MNHNRWIVHVALSLTLLVSSLSYGSAQPVNGGGTITPPPAILNDKNFKPSMLVVIIVLITAFFFMGFFSIYLRQCVGEGQSGIGGSIRSAANIGRRSRRVQKGLDPAVIDTFPTFLYSVVKGLKIGKGTLECAVCLNEFEDDETLRLLPKCDHVFHPECIDAWLGSHTTCPVCRSNLNEDSAASADGDDQNQNQTLESEAATTRTETLTGVEAESVDQSRQQQPEINECQEQVLIRVNDSEQEGSDRHHQDGVIDRAQIPRQNRSKSTRKPKINTGKFPRSHSTGHSLVQPGENVDRFTLRLPVDVRKKIVESELNRSASYANSQTRLKSSGSVKPGVNRSGKYFQFGRLDRAAKSDHWGFKLTVPFFTRNASVRSSGKADGAVNLPLDTIGAKVDGTSTSVAARPPV